MGIFASKKESATASKADSLVVECGVIFLESNFCFWLLDNFCIQKLFL